ncbi:MAG: hypothetical protein B6D61_14750 [Bacteroidetes bacterium 4484_249]|nr:MAG: hypothetical protein B6D61_14750 [Bacteroidetes bacterium 4484_249]
MKIIFSIFTLALLISFSIEARSQGEIVPLLITSPTVCPGSGTCGGVHSTIGSSYTQYYMNTGTFMVYIFWEHQFPAGSATLQLWAESDTRPVQNCAYDAIKCTGEVVMDITGGVLITPNMQLSPVYIYEEELPD